jgi:hypothetical protein
MPIHDWSRVDEGIFHDFHHAWIGENKRALNRALKGTDYYALVEQIAGGLGPDVLTLQVPGREKKPKKPPVHRAGVGIALADSPPQTRFRVTNIPRWYATKKKAVTIRHVSEHRVVAVLEILSLGNKSSRSGLMTFVRKTQDLLAGGVHLALVDLYPPTKRDPEGIHSVVWGEDDDDTFHFDPAKPLTCASYIGGPTAEAFVEPVAVGDMLPTLALFLTPEEYAPVPLETTYQAAFEAVPDFWREILDEPSPGAT